MESDLETFLTFCVFPIVDGFGKELKYHEITTDKSVFFSNSVLFTI